MAQEEDKTMSGAVMFSVAFYTCCSSVMLVANKVALHYNPVPAFVFCAQVACTVGYIFVLRAGGFSEVDTFDWPRVKVFLPYTVSFVLVLYSNGRAIQFSNVETVIVFRAGTPIIVSALDYLVLGRELPSGRSLAALVGMAASVVGYAMADSEFALNGITAYGWVTLYVLSVVFETTYGKKLCQGVKFNAPVWGQVMYCNSLGLLPLVAVGFLSGEHRYLETKGADVGTPALFSLFLSCIVGVGIAWAVWNCRNQVSATLFTLIGVVCKLISVMLNVLIWDKHASAVGIGWLVACLACSSAYRQAPLRASKDDVAPTGAAEAGTKTDAELAEGIGKEEEDVSLMDNTEKK